MNKYLLDTSVIIDFLRGRTSAVELVANPEGSVATSNFCVAEVYEGFYHSHQEKQLIPRFKEFLDSCDNIHGLTPQIASTFGEIRAILKKEGQLIEDIDVFIAATCIEYGLTLVTNNLKHFSRVKGLRIYQG